MSEGRSMPYLICLQVFLEGVIGDDERTTDTTICGQRGGDWDYRHGVCGAAQHQPTPTVDQEAEQRRAFPASPTYLAQKNGQPGKVEDGGDSGQEKPVKK